MEVVGTINSIKSKSSISTDDFSCNIFSAVSSKAISGLCKQINDYFCKRLFSTVFKLAIKSSNSAKESAGLFADNFCKFRKHSRTRKVSKSLLTHS